MSRRKRREEAFITLYAREVGGDYEPETENEFTEELVDRVVEHEDFLDDHVSEFLEDWRMDRVYPVERILLRVGAFEILYTERSKAIVINEAVELAKKYGDEGTGSFVNGILDNLEKSTEPARSE